MWLGSLVTEPQRDRRDVHPFRAQQHCVRMVQRVRGDALGLQRRAVGGCGSGVFCDDHADRVTAQRPALPGREQRLVGLALALFEPRAWDVDGLGGQGRGALLPAFAQDSDVGAAAEVHIADAQAGEFRDAHAGLDDERKQRVSRRPSQVPVSGTASSALISSRLR